MCGIVGYIGEKDAFPIIIKGLQRLEYRGYDSAGVALCQNKDELTVFKKKGKVQDLLDFVNDADTSGSSGIGHTRWATHGPPNDVNAHPHTARLGRLSIIHNGIIENYEALRKSLEASGHAFVSDTDTEVLIHLIEEVQNRTDSTICEAVQIALREVEGAYAIVVMDANMPDLLIAARKSSPLVIGVGVENEYFIASDATPIVEYTQNVIYLDDEEVAVMHREEGLIIRNLDNVTITPEVHELEMQIEAIEKGGFDHFMLKEIFEQPNSIHDSFRGRMSIQRNEIKLSGVDNHWERWENAQRILIIACGTSWHAGLVAEYLFEDFARIPVEVEYASEFRYRNPIIRQDDVVIAISQSGETADTLAAIRLAKDQGAHVFGICNVVGSSIARETDSGAYTHAGPEIGVASTKAFTAQLTVLTLIAMHVGQRNNNLSSARFSRLLVELNSIPEKVEQLLKQDATIKEIAVKFQHNENALYLGRGVNFPVALEGALKLKEISYIHAEGYPSAEMKHGPIALIDEEMPVFFVATADDVYEKVISNVQEVKARGGRLVALVTSGNNDLKSLAEFVIEIPKCDQALAPLLTTIPLQLLSYHIAVLRECHVDQPRNLAKSVTVE
ncbi:MAG: glutamine--fructose-6-phosphate transaminase (isomerizing) [Flavobacteriales bacterium]|nr:glutamine--fructose-6-phosphate transaminase (isomerizing) [Flavobacteriales bacterium]